MKTIILVSQLVSTDVINIFHKDYTFKTFADDTKQVDGLIFRRGQVITRILVKRTGA